MAVPSTPDPIQAFWRPSAPDGAPPPREVRLAVTMVGGISLAIYENGAAQELFQMTRGLGMYGLLKQITCSHAYVDILSGTSAGGINSLFLAAALCQKTDLWPTREIWIRLADIDRLLQEPNNPNVEAVLRGNDFYLPELVKAFSAIADENNASTPTWDRSTTTRPPVNSGCTGNGTDAQYGDLDLFITGTYLRGRPSTFFDARNTPIFCEDFGGVFHLRHRPAEGKSHLTWTLGEDLIEKATDLAGDRRRDEQGIRTALKSNGPARRREICRRLAVIARTTSSLPALFEPSRVERSLMNGVIDLPATHDINYFGDGGYLNNRPINLSLRAIFERPADKEVIRKLIFVEPVPDQYGVQPREEQPPPTALGHLAFWNQVPSHQSLSVWFDQIREHNDAARRLAEELKVVRTHLQPGDAVSPISRDLWLKLRVLDIRDFVMGCWRRSAGLTGFDGLTAGSPADAVENRGLQLARAELLRRVEVLLLEYLEREFLHGDESARARLHSFDPLFLLRILGRASRELRDLLYPGGTSSENLTEYSSGRTPQGLLQEMLQYLEGLDPELPSTLRAAIREVEDLSLAARRIRDAVCEVTTELLADQNLELGRLLVPPSAADAQQRRSVIEEKLQDPEAVRQLTEQAAIALRARLMQLLAPIEGALSPDDVDAVLQTRLATVRADRPPNPVLPTEPADPETMIRQMHGRLAAAFRRAAESIRSQDGWKAALPAGATQRSLLLHEGLEHEDAALEYLDVYLHPIERASRIQCLSEVEVVHVSARDVQMGFSQRSASAKLAGDAFNSLGGFFKRSWRVNDLMWGRLDGSAALLDALLEPGRLERLIARFDSPDAPVATRVLDAVQGYVLGAGATPGSRDDLGAYLDAEYSPPDSGVTGWAMARPKIEAWLRSGTAQLAPDGMRLLKEFILARHQIEILQQEVPDALAEAVAEHAEWQGEDRVADGTPVLRDAAEQGVASGLAVAADMLSRKLGVQPDSPTRSAVGAQSRGMVNDLFRDGDGRFSVTQLVGFFTNEYRIGEETLSRDVPPLVNLERAARGVLATLHVVENSLTERVKACAASRLAGTWVIQPVGIVAGAFFNFTNAMRMGRAAQAAIHAVLWGLIVGGVLLSFTGWNEKFRWQTWGVVVLALLMESLWWSFQARSWQFAGRLMAGVGGPMCVYSLLYGPALSVPASFSSVPLIQTLGIQFRSFVHSIRPQGEAPPAIVWQLGLLMLVAGCITYIWGRLRTSIGPLRDTASLATLSLIVAGGILLVRWGLHPTDLLTPTLTRSLPLPLLSISLIVALVEYLILRHTVMPTWILRFEMAGSPSAARMLVTQFPVSIVRLAAWTRGLHAVAFSTMVVATTCLTLRADEYLHDALGDLGTGLALAALASIPLDLIGTGCMVQLIRRLSDKSWREVGDLHLRALRLCSRVRYGLIGVVVAYLVLAIGIRLTPPQGSVASRGPTVPSSGSAVDPAEGLGSLPIRQPPK